MLWLCVILLVLGTIALLVEIFLPGTEVFGIFGIIAYIIAAVLAVLFVPFGWFVVAGQALIVAGFIWAMVRFAKQKQLKGNLILSENLGCPDAPDLSPFLGKEGKTVTMLRPSGEVDFNGTRLQAAANSGFIAEDTMVRVIEVMSDKVVVKALAEN